MEIIRIFINSDFNIQWILSPWIVLIALVSILAYLLLNKHVLSKNYEIDEAELGVGSAKIRIRPNSEDIQIAYKLWVELQTRKIGLPIDLEHDVIEEVYNSWYEFFKITRELIKNIPATKMRRSESTRKLVRISIDVLNVGLRPHLTKWQARFRRWYKHEYESEKNRGMSPQDIQKKFPDYQLLISDLKSVNDNLIKYKTILHDLAMGK